jgi:hypothetical protein
MKTSTKRKKASLYQSLDIPLTLIDKTRKPRDIDYDIFKGTDWITDPRIGKARDIWHKDCASDFDEEKRMMSLLNEPLPDFVEDEVL